MWQSLIQWFAFLHHLCRIIHLWFIICNHKLQTWMWIMGCSLKTKRGQHLKCRLYLEWNRSYQNTPTNSLITQMFWSESKYLHSTHRSNALSYIINLHVYRTISGTETHSIAFSFPRMSQTEPQGFLTNRAFISWANQEIRIVHSTLDWKMLTNLIALQRNRNYPFPECIISMAREKTCLAE